MTRDDITVRETQHLLSRVKEVWKEHRQHRNQQKCVPDGDRIRGRQEERRRLQAAAPQPLLVSSASDNHSTDDEVGPSVDEENNTLTRLVA